MVVGRRICSLAEGLKSFPFCQLRFINQNAPELLNIDLLHNRNYIYPWLNNIPPHTCLLKVRESGIRGLQDVVCPEKPTHPSHIESHSLYSGNFTTFFYLWSQNQHFLMACNCARKGGIKLCPRKMTIGVICWHKSPSSPFNRVVSEVGGLICWLQQSVSVSKSTTVRC